MTCHCRKDNDISELAVDSGVYFGIIYLRDYFARSNGWSIVYGQTERLWRTGVFAAASMGWNMLPQSLQDAFMYAGEKIASDPLGLCAECQARNLYIVFIQFIVGWFRHGRLGMGNEFWMALDEYVRLVGTDYLSGSVRGMLLGNTSLLRGNLSMTRNAQLMAGQVRVNGPEMPCTGLYCN